MSVFNIQQQKGILTEIQCIEKFIELGFSVSIPYGNANRYDLLVDTGNKIFRVQCKSANLNENGSYTVSTVTSVATMATQYKKFYDSSQIDLMVTIIENQMVFIPVSFIEKSTSRVFRTELPKHGAKSQCNLIEDFSFEKIMKPMIEGENDN